MPDPSRFGGPSPGRLLEPEGDFGPRGMIAALVRATGPENKIRLTGPLGLFLSCQFSVFSDQFFQTPTEAECYIRYDMVASPN